jgi:two-component system CheB/CheR fusion protein
MPSNESSILLKRAAAPEHRPNTLKRTTNKKHPERGGNKIPTLALGYDRVQVLALAPHELTTNAVKHGALKQNGGRLDIRWSVDGRASGFPLLVLVWQKSGVPCRQTFPAVATAELIERELASTTLAKPKLSFGDDGVACRIEMPDGLDRPTGHSVSKIFV